MVGMAIPVQVTFDCADPARLARFWAEALGYVLEAPPEGFESWDAYLEHVGVPFDERNSASALVDPDRRGPRLFFQKVPEPKTVKNRVHLDVNVGGPRGTSPEERRRRVDEARTRLVAAGAIEVSDRERFGERWIVLQDPEGNELCLQ
jgi:hypothetical protein